MIDYKQCVQNEIDRALLNVGKYKNRLKVIIDLESEITLVHQASECINLCKYYQNKYNTLAELMEIINCEENKVCLENVIV